MLSITGGKIRSPLLTDLLDVRRLVGIVDKVFEIKEENNEKENS